MLSYQHHYHAGNFADVHKHLALVAVLTALRRKDKPFRVLDTHAGQGCYPLASQQTGEYRDGIGRLWGRTAAETPLLKSYFEVIKTLNPTPQLCDYPGSPRIIQHFLRSDDRLQLLELHPTAHNTLHGFIRGDHRVHLHQRDAYEGLVALLPPKEQRGLVLLDPSYEVKTEYQTLIKALGKAWRRWQNGIYLIWYPLLPSGLHQRLLAKLTAEPFTSLWHCELEVKRPQSDHGLYGSGLALINPPWQVPEQLTELMPQLASWLNQGEQITRQAWLRNP
jgi:23S rRNA (adenine2030-N6)-methyltransferase